MNKSNKKVKISTNPVKIKGYIYVKKGSKTIGILVWHYKKKRWIFEDYQGKKKS